MHSYAVTSHEDTVATIAEELGFKQVSKSSEVM
jgi:5-oxoprolinase (ATP-hydrolysing)